jgi:D-glycero-beta-D-manno-heptose 1-phosphate adenylyltransferase
MVTVTRKGILSHESNFKDRCFLSYKELEPIVQHCRGLGFKIVLTSGTFDMVHIGHARYLEIAKNYGDFLIVGVDSDEKVRFRKGPERPIVPQGERMEMLAHIRCVDAVVLKDFKAVKWGLIKIVRPDVLVATKETYTKKELVELKKYCAKIVVLDPMATTSTSAKIRRLQLGMANKLEQILTPKLMQAISDSLNEMKK